MDINPQLHPAGTPLKIDYKSDISNMTVSLVGPLRRFCKDNDFYLFGSALTMGDLMAAHESLENGSLTKEQLTAMCKLRAKRQAIAGQIETACDNFTAFAGRKEILLDAVEAHFSGKYTLSVPVLFAQLEGVLRKVGELPHKATFRPTIKSDIWGNRLLFAVGDGAQDFNAFVTKLYAGQNNDAFNRNPVLHGTNITYQTEEYSLILLLAIVETSVFLWFEANTQAIV